MHCNIHGKVRGVMVHVTIEGTRRYLPACPGCNPHIAGDEMPYKSVVRKVCSHCGVITTHLVGTKDGVKLSECLKCHTLSG